MFFDNGFKPPERDSLSDSIEWLGRRARERREIKELRAEADQLKKKVRGRVPGKKSKEAELRVYIGKVKRAAGSRRVQQVVIAAGVDIELARDKKNFPSVAPLPWRKYDLPIKFADIFKRPKNDKLRTLAKSYISKVKA